MVHGRTIRIHLVEGTATGLRTVELINWSGIALVCQRSDLASLANRQEPKSTGVYLLTGQNPDDIAQTQVYIGEGDNVFKRLTSHDQSKDFWTQTALFVSRDGNLTKAHVRYLESRLIKLAHDAQRSSVVNDTQPDAPPLPEPDIADMEYFLEQILLILPIIGIESFQSLPLNEQLTESNATASKDLSPIFEMHVVGAHALGREFQGSFIVLKGSTARVDERQSWTAYKQLREHLIQQQKLAPRPDGQFFEFQEDVPFSSPSAAATVINAGNQNGRTVWHIKGTSKTYQNWLDDKLAQAGLADGKSRSGE